MFRNWKRNKWRGCVFFLCFVVFGTVISNEYLIYELYKFRWPVTECGDSNNFYRVLLVADPQILGENDESWIAIWDSDRFLSKTFHQAVWHVKPSLIVFLGDLMDEGSVATDSQYERYYKRFYRIFSLNKFRDKALYLPGDNDIGGERDDVVTSAKVLRFQRYFSQPDIFQTGEISFFKVNHMERTYPSTSLNDTAKVRVALSHIPILDIPTRFMQRAVTKIRPNIIFSAHDHHSIHFLGNQETGERFSLEEMEMNDYTEPTAPSWRFQVNSKLTNEMVVPTCSYRMGTPEIGYSVALIDAANEVVCYNILWLPSRISILELYLYTIIPSAFLSLLWRITYYCGRSNFKLPL